MYSSLAGNSSSPLVYFYTLGMLVIIPIALFVIGIVNVRKENPNERRAGYAMLKIAGLITAVVAIAFVFMFLR